MIDRELISESILKKKVVEIPVDIISSININPRRHGTIKENVEKLISAGEFPEIHLGLFEGELVVVDGYHRLEATRTMEKEVINAFVTEYEDMLELKKQAFLANVNHGIMLSEYDIAINIHEFYTQGKIKKPDLKIREVVAEYGVPERKGRMLLIWSIIMKEVLESTVEEIKDLSKCEEMFKLITAKGEKIGSISETFKDEFKRFYIKYLSLPQAELRLAVHLHIDGKDYYQEKEKEARIKKEEEEYRRQYDDVEDIPTDTYAEKLSSEDEVERDANVEYSETIKPLESKTTETQIGAQVAEFEEKKEEEAKKMRSVTNTLMDVTEKLMGVDFLVARGQADITQDDLIMLKDIKERLEILIDTTSSVVEKKEAEEI